MMVSILKKKKKNKKTSKERFPALNKTSKVIIQKANTSEKRVYDIWHCCYFCDKEFKRMPRHLLKMHKNESQIAEIQIMKNKLQNKALLALQKAGDFNHNCIVLEKQEGKLILTRRPEKEEPELSKYGPCPRCLGFMLKKNLWRHTKSNKCPEIKNKAVIPAKEVRVQSAALTAHILYGTNLNFNTEILGRLMDDDVGNLCREDEIIQIFGYMLYQKLQEDKAEYIRCKMREIARLVLIMNEKRLQDCISTSKFDYLVKCIQELCLEKQDNNNKKELGIPSLALKLGHSLRKVALIIRGSAIKTNNFTKDKEMQDFLTLMSREANFML